MIIDNGSQVDLSIPGVFEGTAGLAKGLLAFIPNLSTNRAERARRGRLDGRDVALEISRVDKGPMYIATFVVLP